MIEHESMTDILHKHGIFICHGFNPFKNKGGVTIAYSIMNDFKNTRMVEVAVAYCSPHDVFNKKIGTQIAVDRFLNNETIMVPARTDKSNSGIPDTLRKMFWESINPVSKEIFW
jgi:hypothetical protein